MASYAVDINNLEGFKDKNKVTCLNCGYIGIIHDLVPEYKENNNA
mgnify:CR=1 FL=1